MTKVFVFLIVLLSCLSCKKESVTEVPPQTPYELWRSKNLHDYTIDQVRACFCPDGGEVVRITVRSDTISVINKISDASVVTSPYYFTIDSLFGMIKYGNYDSLVIRYNSIYGYPEYLDINPQWHPVDGGMLYETSNLKKLQ